MLHRRTRFAGKPSCCALGVWLLAGQLGCVDRTTQGPAAPTAAADGNDPGLARAPEFAPLNAEEREIADALKQTVTTLTEKIGERSVKQHWELASAADYLVERFEDLTYPVARYGYELGEVAAQNLEATARGGDLGDELVIVGAHYDTKQGSVGADDNASGVAVLLALAERFKRHSPRRTVRFVAFVASAPPYTATEDRGSRRYVRRISAQGDRVACMLSIDSVGVYSSKPGSQRRHEAFRPPLPETADFVALLGDESSMLLAQAVQDAFPERLGVPAIVASPTRAVESITDSDHVPFRNAGIPAVVVTDTWPLRGLTDADLVAQLDFSRMARVVVGLEAVLERLASPEGGREIPMPDAGGEPGPEASSK